MRPAEELYDLRSDPDCLRNLANSANAAEAKKVLEKALFAELKQQGDPRVSGQGQVFDQYPHANPGHAGFYERFMRGEKLKTGWVNQTDFEQWLPQNLTTNAP